MRHIKKEIVELHQFFEDWFTGSLKDTDRGFNRLSGVISGDFEIISPSGQTTRRNNLLKAVNQAYASRKAYRIWIENVRSRSLGDGLYLATYEEWQEVEGKTRGRLSTVIFRDQPGTPNGLLWLYVHETWLPEEA